MEKNICGCGQIIDTRELECLKNFKHKSRNDSCLVCGHNVHLGNFNSSAGIEVTIKWKCKLGTKHKTTGRVHSETNAMDSFNTKQCRKNLPKS